MKIAKIEQFFPRRRMRLVKITTDNGLVGWGETTLEGKPMSTIAAVNELAEYLTGKDPLRIEHHWQHIYRSAFFRGGNVLMSALAGIDQALWDISGKYYQVPTYKLLGGAVRDRIRVYAHWGIGSRDEKSLEQAKIRLEWLQKSGYTAFKSGPSGKWRAHEPPAVVDDFVACANLMREWVGDEIEIGFDFHGKMTPSLAIEVCHQLQPMRPMFVEEPVPQENVDALKQVSDHVIVPVATGERLLSRWEFRKVFETQAVAYIQPDVSHAGGISEVKKIANMAEIYYVHIMPHCAIGPIAFSACLQVDAVVPNFLIQEQIDAGLGNDLFETSWKVENGYIELPTGDGLGFEVDEKLVRQDDRITQDKMNLLGYGLISSNEELGGEFYHLDGSVADW